MIPNKLMITSSKGGIGKSSVAVGLAHALTMRGLKVLLIDCDFGNCCLDMLLGLEDDVIFTLNDREEILKHPENVLLHPSFANGDLLFFAPAPRGGVENPDPETLPELFACLEEACSPDYVIVDTAAGIEIPQALASSYIKGALVVASQVPVSLRAAENTARSLENKGLSYIRMVINMFEDFSVKNGERLGILSMIDQAAVQTIGIVPKDRARMISAEKGEIPSEKSPSSVAFRNMASRLLNEPVKLFFGIRSLRTKKLL
ncbi:MAG: P-loop NTPase [Clostridia bacterium]|nr:P-loop NTPase [Clostridia bacterium]